MNRHMPAIALVAGLFVACSSPDQRDVPSAEPGDLAGQPVARTAGPDLFVAAPSSASQLIFVAQEPPSGAAEWPGAVFVPLSTFSVERDGIPNEFPPAEDMAARLRAAGVRGSDIVIVGDPIPAGRAWAALDLLGLGDRAALLDGGVNALGSPPQADNATRTGAAPGFPVNVRDDMIVDAAWVHERLEHSDIVILDARPPAEFSGETPGEGIARPGHIPGARNVFWQTLVASPGDPRLRDEAELRRIFEEAGVRPGSTVVAYCRTGGQAAFLYTVARHLGYDVRLYDGSFVDWSRTDYAVER